MLAEGAGQRKYHSVSREVDGHKASAPTSSNEVKTFEYANLFSSAHGYCPKFVSVAKDLFHLPELTPKFARQEVAGVCRESRHRLTWRTEAHSGNVSGGQIPWAVVHVVRDVQYPPIPSAISSRFSLRVTRKRTVAPGVGGSWGRCTKDSGS